MSGVLFLAGAGIFLFAAVPGQVTGPVQLTVWWKLGTLSPYLKRLKYDADQSTIFLFFP
jgi:hypothetical protein